MRYWGLIIDDLGDQSKNRRSDVTSTSGVQNNEILRYLSSGQAYIQSQILRQVGQTNFFNSSQDISIVNGTKEYTLSGNVYYKQKVKRVRYSSSGLARDYRDLKYLVSERWTEDAEISTPSAYSVGNNTIILDSVPSSSAGSLRVVYVASLDRPEIRRGKIQSVANDGTNYTSIVLEDDSDLDGTNIARYLGDYLCVNSVLGVVNYYNAQISAYDAGTRTITLTNSLMSAGTIAAGAYITLGRYSTTHSKLPDECEHYLMEFADWKLKKGDSSSDSVEANQEMVMLMDDIIAQFANATDMQTVMIYDPDADFA